MGRGQEIRVTGRRAWIACALALVTAGCSVRRIAVDGLAGALASSGDVFASDDDPELVREALPFGLKTMEALMQESPENRDILLAATRGFTQYSYAFVEGDMHLLDEDDFDERDALAQRALRLYLRAKNYGLRGLELRYEGLAAELVTEPRMAVRRLHYSDLDLTYWTAAAWGGAIGLALDRPEIVADVDAMRALLARVLELEPGYGNGAIHEALISVEALPEAMGGSPVRARQHLDLALEWSQGQSAGAYVSYVPRVTIRNQDHAEFVTLLNAALAIDPDEMPSLRLANILAQRRARKLLDSASDYFLDL